MVSDMRLDEFLKSNKEDSIKKFISTINIIEDESSMSLMNQLRDRLNRLNKKITHQQSREAGLKRKLDLVDIVLKEAVSNELESEIIDVLSGFKFETIDMLKRIDYKNQEEERERVFKIKQTIINRSPIMKRILGIIRNASTT